LLDFDHQYIVVIKIGGSKGAKNLAPSRAGMDSPLTESLNTSLPKFLLMAVTDGASVTETPRLKRGSMWYASAPFNSPIRGHSTLTPVLGVGATLSACGASPSTRSERLRARWGHEAGSSALHGGVAHYYPDNVYEDILVFKKPGKFIPRNKEESKIDVNKFQREKWYLSVWEITNVLPQDKYSKYSAPFPEELARRIITLYSYVGDTVLDPFAGTGTTLKVANELKRNAIGYEIDLELKDIILERICVNTLFGKPQIDIIEREDAKRLRTKLREKIEETIQKRGLRGRKVSEAGRIQGTW